MAIKNGYKCECGCIDLKDEELTLISAKNDTALLVVNFRRCPSCGDRYFVSMNDLGASTW